MLLSPRMQLLKTFLKQEMMSSQHKYISPIITYYHEKFDIDPKQDSDDNFIVLVYKANKTSAQKRDTNFLTLLSLFFSIGIALLDDIYDNDLSPVWKKRSKKEVTNIACHFLFVFPHTLILKSNHIKPLVKLKLIKLISEYYIRITTGEYKQASNSLANLKNISLATILEAMALKTGQWHALQAAVAVCYANSHASQDNSYIKLAREIGLFKQIRNDMHDAFVADQSQDLLNGVLNFPLATYIIAQKDSDRKALIKRIALKKQRRSSTKALRKKMIEDGQLTYCTLVLNIQKTKVMDLLQSLALPKKTYSSFVKLVEV